MLVKKNVLFVFVFVIVIISNVYSQRKGNGIYYICLNKEDSVLIIHVTGGCYNKVSIYSNYFFEKYVNCLLIDLKKESKRYNYDTCYATLNEYVFEALPNKFTKNIKTLSLFYYCSDCLGTSVFSSNFLDSFEDLQSLYIHTVNSTKGDRLYFLGDVKLEKLELLDLEILRRKNMQEFPVEAFLNIKYLFFSYPKCYPFLGIGLRMIRSLRRFIEENPHLKAMEIPFNGRYLKKIAKERGIILNY